MPVSVGELDFELLVSRALAEIPAQLAKAIENVAVIVEPYPPDGRMNLLGLYEGVPLTARGGGSYAGYLPDRITIYREPILEICETQEEVVAQVRVTVMHEVGHYFGLEHDALDELGYT